VNIQTTESYINNMLEQFSKDPPSTDYQQGYQAALLELRNAIRTPETVGTSTGFGNRQGN
jgi:hypothetical protein